jgi:flagellar hook-length control protein FliK
MPTLPQTPAAGFKGSGAVRPTTPDSPGDAAGPEEGQSFLATLNRISDAETHGSIHNQKSIPTEDRHDLSEGSATAAGVSETSSDPLESVQDGSQEAAVILSEDASPLFNLWQTVAMNSSLPFGLGMMDQQHPLFENRFELLAADISPQATTLFHFEHLITKAGLNSDTEGKMGMNAQFLGFWQWIAQITRANEGAPIEQPLASNTQMTVSDKFPVHWTDSFLGAISDNNGLGGQPASATAHAIQLLEDLFLKMESNSGTNGTAGLENPKTGLWEKDQALLPGTQNDPLLAMHLDSARDQKSKTSRQSRFQTGHTAAANSAIQNLSAAGLMAKPAEEVLSLRGAAIKFQVPVADEFGGKVFHIEGDNKDSGLPYANDQMLERVFKLEDASRTSEPLQRNFSSDTLNQIVQKAVLSLKNGHNEVRIDLKPDFLGHIRMQIITESQQVAVRIYAESPFVKDMLESNLHQLKSELQAQGLVIDELEVSVGYGSDREADPNPNNAELRKLKAAGSSNPTDAEPSEDPLGPNSDDGERISETAIDYFA